MSSDREGERQPDSGEAMAIELEQALRDVVAAGDPAPDALVRYAAAAWALRDLDEELAELVQDSWVDANPLTRAPGATRMLAFESGGGRLEVGVTRTAEGYELTGQVVPPASGEVRVIFRGGSISRPVDDHGRFDADLPGVASIRLWLRTGAVATEAPIVTSWVPMA